MENKTQCLLSNWVFVMNNEQESNIVGYKKIGLKPIFNIISYMNTIHFASS